MADINQSIEVTLESQQANKALTDLLATLTKVTKQFGELNKVNFSNLVKNLNTVKEAANNISKATENISSSTKSNHISSRTKTSNNSGSSNNPTSIARANALAEKANAYAESVSKQASKEVNEASKLAQARLKAAQAELTKLKAEIMRNGGSYRYTADARGGVASALIGAQSRLRNKQGVVGLATRFGTQLGSNTRSAFGERYGAGGSSFISRLAGGGVAGSKGLNLGGLAFGGFVSGLIKGTEALGKFNNAALDAFSGIEMLKTQMSVVYKSSSQGNLAFEQIANYATRSPFSVTQSTEMAVLLKQSGVYASELQQTLEMIGDVSSGNEEKMKRIANNYAQIQAIGHANMLDMRQFAYAGLPIYEEVAKTLKVSQSELRSMISDGKVSAEVMEETFKRMTGETGTFYKAVNKGAKTRQAREINLGDTKNLALAEVGDYLWNSDYAGGLNKGILGIKEKFWNKIGSIGNSLNANASGTTGARNELFLNSLKEAYRDALRAENKPLMEKILAEIKVVRTTNGEGEIRAQLYKSAEKKLGIKGKRIINEEEREELRNKIISIAGVNFTGGTDKTSEYYQNYSDKMLVGLRGNVGTPAQEAALKYYQNLLKTSVTTEKFNKSLNKLLDSVSKFGLGLAYVETKLEQYTQSVADSLNKVAGGAKSLTSLSSKYRENWKNSPEYKAMKEQEEIREYQRYKADYDKYSSMFNNEKNILDAGNLSLADVKNFFNSGLVSATQLQTSKEYLGDFSDKENREKLWNKISDNIRNTDEFIRFNKNDKDFKVSNKTLSLISDIKKKLSLWRQTGDKGAGLLSRALYNLQQQLKDESPSVRSALENLTFTNLEKTATYEQFYNGSYSSSGNVFIPLWKRIIASNTGLSSNVIESTQKSLDLYHNDIVARNASKGVFSQLMRNGGLVKDIQRLLASDGVRKELRGDTGGTVQIDWKQARENVENFATSLRATTDYIKAYKSALQSELDTFNNLMSEGIATFESQDIKNAKTISASSYSELIKDAGDQLVNAFGEKLYVLQNGKKVEVGDVREGIAYDKEGNKLASQELIIDGNLYKYIQTMLPVLRDKLIDISNKELSITVYSDIANKVGNQELDKAFKSVNLLNAGNDAANYKESILSNAISAMANRRGITKDDLIKSIAEGTVGEEEITNAISNAMKYFYSNPSSLYGKERHLILQNEGLDALTQIYSGRNKRKTLRSDDLLDRNNKYTFTDFLFRKSALNGAGIGNDININGIDYDIVNRQRRSVRAGVNIASSELKDTKSISSSALENLKKLGVNQDYLDTLGDINAPYRERLALLEQIAEENKDITAETARQAIASESAINALSTLGNNIKTITKESAKKAFTSTFETLGKNLALGNDAAEGLKDNMHDITLGLLQQVGAAMASAGFQIAAAGAMEHNWAMVAGGLGLAAAGGFTSGFAGALQSASEDSDNTDEKAAKLESLADKLAELLEQAREDAIYYENNLRHRKALGINSQYSNKVTSVNDAIITPSGNVISTAPDDYLIATKTPETLGGAGNVNVQPKVSVVINKNTSSNVDVNVETSTDTDGSVQVVAYIEDIVSNYIASAKSDDAFFARQVRQNGKRSIM